MPDLYEESRAALMVRGSVHQAQLSVSCTSCMTCPCPVCVCCLHSVSLVASCVFVVGRHFPDMFPHFYLFSLWTLVRWSLSVWHRCSRCEVSAVCTPVGAAHLVARLVQHPLMDSLLAWMVPCLVMDSSSEWCFSRLDLHVHLKLMDLRILAGCIEAPRTRPLHLFGFASRCIDSEVLVCKATASPSSNPETLSVSCNSTVYRSIPTTALRASRAISGSSSSGSLRGSWFCPWAPFMSLVCSACWHMSARRLLVVSAS